MTATEVGNRPVQDNADTGDDDDDDHIIGPLALPVSCGPAPTVPVSCGPAPTDVKVEEEMCKKDEFSPATSERGVDVQDKVDEADVAKDDCPREPKKWGPTQQMRARWKRNLSNTEYSHRKRKRKIKRDQRCMLEAYSPDVAVPYYLQRGTRNDYSRSTSEMVYGRHRHRRSCMHVADPVNNIDGMSSTSTHRNEPSSMPINEPVHDHLLSKAD